MVHDPLEIRAFEEADAPALWDILRPVFRAGDTYTIDPDTPRDEALSYWTGASHGAFVVLQGNDLLGSYYLKRNQAGGGSHVCNCGYVTAPAAQGRGVARHMLADSLSRARDVGFRAMQYNFVISTNTRAIATWQRAGFDVVGKLPGAFKHPEHGFVDALVMYKTL